MSKRSLTYIKTDWTGGVNTSRNSGMISDNDLVQADNVLFSTSGARLKREGLSYSGTAIPAVTHRSSSGTTHTLVFASSISTTGPTNEILCVGDKITITSTGTGNDLLYVDTNVDITAISTTTVTNDTITYVGTQSVSEGSTSTSTITVKRAYDYLNIADYYYYDTSNVQQNLFMAVSEQGRLYSYDSNNRRTRIKAQLEEFTITCPVRANFSGDNANYITFYSGGDGTEYNLYIDYDGTAVAPSPGGTVYEVDLSVGITTAAEVAAKFKTVIDSITGAPFTTSLVGAVLTVKAVDEGVTTDATNVNIVATDFSVAKTVDGIAVISSTVSKATSLVVNGRFVTFYTGLGNKPFKYNPDDDTEYTYLGGTSTAAPDGEFGVTWRGRVWTNDKTDRDRMHYSATGDIDSWIGASDSGALDMPSDGDIKGITAAFVFKDSLFVAKNTKLYRVSGYTPYDFRIDTVSEAIGIVNQQSVVQLEDDVVFMSNKGIHSLVATDTYGDVSPTFISAAIQPTFNNFNTSRLQYSQGAYVPEINSIAWSISDNADTQQADVWLFNLVFKAWYRWPEIDCQSVTSRQVSNKTKLMFGTSDGRLIQAQNGTYTDFGTTGITYRIKTGTIYPNGDVVSVKGFKKIGFFYQPTGDFQFTGKIKVENQANQPFVFEQETSGAKLGVDFILAESVLGFDSVLAPYVISCEGRGRGCVIEVEQTGTEEQIEIYGFLLEYLPGGQQQEVVTNAST